MFIDLYDALSASMGRYLTEHFGQAVCCIDHTFLLSPLQGSYTVPRQLLWQYLAAEAWRHKCVDSSPSPTDRKWGIRDPNLSFRIKCRRVWQLAALLGVADLLEEVEELNSKLKASIAAGKCEGPQPRLALPQDEEREHCNPHPS